MNKIYYRSGQTFESDAERRDFRSLCKRHVEGLSSQNQLETWKKEMFRKSPVWRMFCRDLVVARGSVCECCGKSRKDVPLVVHHRDPWHYDKLDDKSLFSVLCNACHLRVETFCKTKDKMQQCPRIMRKFLTIRPYKDEGEDVLAWQSGTIVLDEWKEDCSLSEMPKVLNKTKPKVKRSQLDEAEEFMRQHPDLFK